MEALAAYKTHPSDFSEKITAYRPKRYGNPAKTPVSVFHIKM